MEIHIIRNLDLSGMYLKDCFPSFQIRKFNRNSTVESTRTGKCRIKRFRSVCCRQDDNAVVSFKAIHLSQELVQGLFSFIISSDLSVTLLTDRIDLINKYDTWCFFLCLLEQISDLGGTHTYKHFYEFRTGHREERYIGLSRNCFCKHCFTGSRRTY